MPHGVKPPDAGTYYYDTMEYPSVGNGGQSIKLYLQPGTVTVTSPDSLDNARINGGQLNTDYDEISIPQNFIVGPDGKIVARDLHGADLEKKLSEIYK